MDRRYGVLKLISESSTAKLRKQNTCAQLLCILGMVPVNLFLAVIFTYFLMPLLVAMAILIWNCRCHCLDRITKKFICDQQILFLYLLVTMQDVSSVSGSCILTFIDLACSENTQVLDMRLGVPVYNYCIFHCTFFTIPRLLHILRSPKRFKIFTNILTRMLPLLVAFWQYADIGLDIVQTRKYRNLWQNKKSPFPPISPFYWIFSMISLFVPTLLSFCLILYHWNGFRVIRYLTGNRKLNSNLLQTFHIDKITTLMILLLTLEFIIGIPIYLVLSVMFYYIAVPMVLIQHGLDTIRKGKEDERVLEFNPFKIISRHSRYKGVMDLVGLTQFKSKNVPLIEGMEQIGEASIQTIVSLVFLINNYENIKKEDTFLGIPFPVSIISCVFSIVSLLRGIFTFSNVVCKINK